MRCLQLLMTEYLFSNQSFWDTLRSNRIQVSMRKGMWWLLHSRTLPTDKRKMLMVAADMMHSSRQHHFCQLRPCRWWKRRFLWQRDRWPHVVVLVRRLVWRDITATLTTICQVLGNYLFQHLGRTKDNGGGGGGGVIRVPIQFVYGVSWPSGLVHWTQVLVLSECGFKSRPGRSRHLCPWARHLINRIKWWVAVLVRQ